MFETFNCAGLYIALQAVLELATSLTSRKVQDWSLTGTVVDSGHSATQVIPIVEGYVIGSSIKSILLPGATSRILFCRFSLTGESPTATGRPLSRLRINSVTFVQISSRNSRNLTESQRCFRNTLLNGSQLDSGEGKR